MKDCFNSGACELSDARVWNSSLFLLKVAEHTWGLSTEGDTVNWANDKFHAIQFTRPSFVRITSSWVEQREFVYLAVEALQDHPVVRTILNELSRLSAAVPDLRSFDKVANPSQLFKCGSSSMNIGFGRDGSVVHLDYQGTVYATDQYPMTRFDYITYNERDFNAFGAVYNYNSYSPGYSKPNLTKNFDAVSKRWDAAMTTLYQSRNSECEFYAVVTMSEPQSHTRYGAPESVWIHYAVIDNGIRVDVHLFNKTSTRLPEALYVSFHVNPSVDRQRKYKTGGSHAQQWSMAKIGGRPVDPHNVILNGSQYTHVLGDGGVTHFASGLKIASLDIPVTVPITPNRPPTAFPAPLSPISEDITGFAFNIYNNIWECNWIMWYPYLLPEDNNFKARFHVDFSKVRRNGERKHYEPNDVRKIAFDKL